MRYARQAMVGKGEGGCLIAVDLFGLQFVRSIHVLGRGVEIESQPIDP